jgi:hypothetical protein
MLTSFTNVQLYGLEKDEWVRMLPKKLHHGY